MTTTLPRARPGHQATAPTPEAFRDVLRALRGRTRTAPPPAFCVEPLLARPAVPRKPWDAVLVVDGSPSMRLWSSVVRGVERSLRASGVFRNVVVRKLGVDGHGPVIRDSGRAGMGAGAVVDAYRQRVVLVLTDCAHPMWKSGRMWSPLRRWGAAHPVVLISLVPWSVAGRGGLAVHRLRLRANRPGTANHVLQWRPRADPLGAYDDLAGAMPVCFSELDLVGLRRWGDLTGRPSAWTDTGAILVPDRPQDSVEPPALSPAELVSAFRTNSSPDAFRLAVYLAAVPLELQLMTQVGERLLPRTSQAALAELLASPLIEPREAAPAGMVNFQFTITGLRGELLGFGRRSETEYVREVVRRHLSRRHGVTAVERPEDADEADMAVHGALSGQEPRAAVPRTSVHRAIVAVDVESYGNPARTSYHRMAARAGIYDAMATACAEARVPWDPADVSDSGDGLLLLFPAEVPKVALVDILPTRLAAAVRRHNAVHAPAADSAAHGRQRG
ncbi:SAV_2336 N-terminal domain-related protein [Amycolatopsis sp. lyj-23]|uniref:SAV_2336 N-terminal domain-related protein n=1 Tax=Amycolatopsis sp. lyj-23 TaxID=2789283 RepID=UPI00397B45BF